jgi:6-phosphogluconolactonase (cycloisomerase 2 family)
MMGWISLKWKLPSQPCKKRPHGYTWAIAIFATLVTVACGGASEAPPAPVVANAHLGYVWEGATLQVFHVDSAGQPTAPKSFELASEAGSNVFAVGVHPNRRFVYAVTTNTRTSPPRVEVRGFNYDVASGTLSSMASSPFLHSGLMFQQGSPRTGVSEVLIHPTGGLLFVTLTTTLFNEPAFGQIFLSFKVDPETGALVDLGEHDYGRQAVGFFPFGSFFVVGEDYIGSTSIYPVDISTGALGASAPWLLAYGWAAHPSGRWVVSLDVGSPVAALFAMDSATGAVESAGTFRLTNALGEPLSAEASTFSSDGRYLYVASASEAGSTVRRFAFDEANRTFDGSPDEQYAVPGLSCLASQGGLLFSMGSSGNPPTGLIVNIASLNADDGSFSQTGEVRLTTNGGSSRCGWR